MIPDDDGSDLACAKGGHVWIDVGARGVTVEQECQFCAARRVVFVEAVDHTPEPQFETNPSTGPEPGGGA